MAEAQFKGEEYVFPDEEKSKNKPEEEKFEVEVEDDTPIEDRGRKPMKEPVEEVTDEELSNYDEKVQARIKKFTRGYHDERRAKESALRERIAVENYAKQLLEQNKSLQQQVSHGTKAYVEQSKSRAEVELDSAKRSYKEAYDSGDSDALVEAQTRLNRASIYLDKVENFKPALQNRENDVQTRQSSENKPNVTPRDERWMQNNTWFGPDSEMTATALGLHQKLAGEYGQQYIGTDEYYQRIDTTMRKRYPEYFTGSDEDDDTPQKRSSEPAYEETPRRATKPASVVAPANRSTPPNRIRLKASEAAIARRLGVPLEEYAKQVAQLKRGE
tara:strand:+ start:606 stop:1595 length:990 start_codon:yes stop_codon:yes gene_type:complete